MAKYGLIKYEGKYEGINKGKYKGIKKEPVPCIHGFRGDFISPAKKPGSA
jgi:hypothetical protein